MTEQRNIHQRLAAAMGEVTYIQKERKQGMQYTIVSHDAVTAKVRPVLLKHGIVYYPTSVNHTQNGNRAECSMTVRFVNIDEPADFFEVQTFGYGVDNQDKGPGKAMSYAVKYALLKAMGLETGDDADHDSIPHQQKDPAKVAPKVSEADAAILDDMASRAGSDRAAIFDALKVQGDSWSDLPESLFIKVRDGMQRKLDQIDAEHDNATKEE
jgi:hypothetical protein